MCIHALKKAKITKRIIIPQGGCASLPNVPKVGVSGFNDTAKTNKD